ncbi:MAG: hypothetical protein JWO67_3167 [Streptosporangiaceae bacterium]|nr:hypothetical protein [Streptosporangiaceae bacterium]
MRLNKVRVALPYIACPDCSTQLVNHLYVDLLADELLCVFCAKTHPPGTVAPLHADSTGFATGEAPALDPEDAIALLIRHGAKLEEIR